MRTSTWASLAALARRPGLTSIPAGDPTAVSTHAPAGPAVRGPQPTLDRPARALPRHTVDRPGPFVLGVHGGAGESLIAALLGWEPAQHSWPVAPTALTDQTTKVVLTCRSDQVGLLAARDASREWAASTVPGVDLVGLVVIADAPGRLPRPLQDLCGVITGGLPHCWHLPWQPALRLGARADPNEPAVRRLVDAISAATCRNRTALDTDKPVAPDDNVPATAGPPMPAVPAGRTAP